MRVILTADLHYNHPRSREPADRVIDDINRAGGDVLVVVGDTAVPDAGDGALEACLGRFTFSGPKLFVAGNHELWMRDGGSSIEMHASELPRRIRALGWHWLEDQPFVTPGRDVALVGSVGWYDFSFAQASLAIPLRFYRSKISPGAADYLGGAFASLLADRSDLSPHAMSIVARWNDGKFVHLGGDEHADERFLDRLLLKLDAQLGSLADVTTVVAAIHHLPFAELLPPSRAAQWDFAKAYLGSAAIGRTLLKHPNVRHVFCGHSHFPARASIAGVQAINIGSGYRAKTFQTLEL